MCDVPRWMFGLPVFKNLCWKSINKKEYLHTEFNKSFDKILFKYSNLIQRRSKEAVSFSQVKEQWGWGRNWGHMDVCNERGSDSPNNLIRRISENWVISKPFPLHYKLEQKITSLREIPNELFHIMNDCHLSIWYLVSLFQPMATSGDTVVKLKSKLAHSLLPLWDWCKSCNKYVPP